MNEDDYDDYNYNADFENDDAREYYKDEHSCNHSRNHENDNNDLHKDSNTNTILETDTIWNVQLVIDCWALILNHAKETILDMKKGNYLLDNCDQITTISLCSSSDSSDSSDSHGDSSQSVVCSGVILNRWG
eukprot:399498_1